MADSVLNPVTSTITAAATSGAAGATGSTGVDKNTIAGNFQTFLTLLTTQLKNQNPLDPLDTNQFTQQLVQFAQVEQQLQQNEQLATLVSIEKTAQATTALAYVGQTVAVDGDDRHARQQPGDLELQSPKPVNATVTIKSATGQTVYSGSFAMNAGAQSFTWDGRDNDGVKWPDGNYTLSVDRQGRQRPGGVDPERGRRAWSIRST